MISDDIQQEFKLEEGITYLNCATFSPTPTSSIKAGIEALQYELSPHLRSSEDFFSRGPIIQKLFAKLIHCEDPDRIAFIPSASYGLANVAKNLKLKGGDELLFLADQFPSDIYAFQEVAEQAGAKLIQVPSPSPGKDMAEIWQRDLINHIQEKTAMVCVPNVHWSTGTVFDLHQVGQACRDHGTLLIIDGTQSIGAMHFNLQTIKADAVVCSGYKWLLGTYSTGLAYYGPYFDDGMPVENNWINRVNSDDFKNLINYQDDYRPKAFRYNVGEWSNFCLLPILQKSLELVVKWSPELIQNHTYELKKYFHSLLKGSGFHLDMEGTSNHLFGATRIDRPLSQDLKKQLNDLHIYVALRGNSIRISPHLYNDFDDMAKLAHTLKRMSSDPIQLAKPAQSIN